VSAIDLASKLIVYEGLDFTGKSTLAYLLAKRLRETGISVVSTGEPGGTNLGQKVRELLLSRENTSMLPLSELLLFITSRAQHAHEVILPALREGRTVITSRYRLSSMAYQGYGRGIDLELVRRLNDAATCGREADITLLIDVPVETALARKHGEGDRIEREDEAFYGRVRRGFLELAREDPRAFVVDGTGTIDEIHARIVRLLRL
jgi:dTMP kinase